MLATSRSSHSLWKTNSQNEPQHRRQKWFITEDKLFTPIEVRRVLKHCEEELAGGRITPVGWLFMNVAFKTGLRVSEIANLNCGDVSHDAFPTVMVRHGKCSKDRVVEIDEGLAENAKKYLSWKADIGEDTGPHAPFFISSRRKRYTTRGLEKIFKRIVTAAGIKKKNNIHMARHSYASDLIRASNNDWNFVRDQLGHSSILVTQVYVHTIRSSARKALARMYQ